MAQFETWIRSDLKKPVNVQPLHGVVFTADSLGNRVGVEVTDGGEAAALSGNVLGYVLRADGATLTVPGALSGNRASILLPASAYAVQGPLDIVIKLTSGSGANAVTVSLGACRTYVQRSSTDSIIDPGHVIPSLEELLAQIAVIEQAVADANTAAQAANTAAQNADSKATAANTAASNANSKATAANTAAQTANTAAQNANAAAAGIQQYDSRITSLESGKVDRAGDTMSGDLSIKKATPALALYKADGSRYVARFSSLVDSQGNNRAGLAQRTDDSTGQESYLLPVPDTTSSGKAYYFLTTKETVTVGQGGTGANTLAGAKANLGVAYKAGDTYTLTDNVPVPVIVSTSTTFYIPITTDKSLENITAVTVTALQGTVRHNGVYLGGGANINWLTASGVTVTAKKVADNMVRILVTSDTAWEGVDNRQFGMMFCRCTLSFS